MPRSELYYWGTVDSVDQWVQATTPSGGNALINLDYSEKMHGHGQVECTLINASATTAFAAGNLEGKFTDFQRVKIIDGTTKLVIFYGRLFDIDKNFDMQYGPTILVTCRDALFELGDVEMSDSTNIPLAFGSGTSRTKRSQLISSLVERFSKDNISTSDTDKFEASYMPYVVANGAYNLSGGKKSVLSGIREIANSDPINGDITGTVVNDSTEFGHDFYAEPRFTNVNSSTEEGTSDLNYFKRGSRVDPPATFGLTAKFAVRGGTAETGQVTNMLPGYDFDQPQQELYTDVNGYFSYDDRRKQARKFELWSGASLSGTFTGALATSEFRAGEQIFTKEALASVANNGSSKARFTVSGGHGLPLGGTVTIAGTTNYNAADQTITAVTATTFDTAQSFTAESLSGATATSPVYGRIHYVSATPVLMLVSIFSEPYTLNAPKVTANITGKTSGASITLNARSSVTWGIKRSGRVEYAGTPDPESVKNQLVSMMARSITAQIRGTFTVSGFPHHKAEDQTASATGGTISAFADAGGGEVTVTTGTHGLAVGDSVVITGTTNYNGRFDVNTVPSTSTFTITDTFVANDATGVASGDKITTTSFSPLAYGLRAGMVVEKLSGTGGSRVAYGYCKAVTATTITVQLDGTNAWTVGGGDYYNVVVPERPGMQVRVINPAVGIAGSDHIITEVAYSEGPGQLIGRLKTSGENDVTGATPTFGTNVYTNSKDEGLPNAPPSSQVSFKYDGDWTAASGGLNVSWSGGKTVGSDSNVSTLTLSDGREFNICGNTSASPTTKRPDVVSVLGGALTASVPYVVYFDVDGQTEDDDPGEPDPLETYQFSVALKSTYDAAAESGKLDDILIAYVTRPSDAAITASSDIEAEFVLLQNAGRASMVSAETGIANRTIVPGLLETDFLLAGKLAVRNPSTSGANATNKQRFKFDATAGNGWFRGYSESSTSDSNYIWFDFDADDKRFSFGTPTSGGTGITELYRFSDDGVILGGTSPLQIRGIGSGSFASPQMKDVQFSQDNSNSLDLGVTGSGTTVTTFDITGLDGAGILNAGSVTTGDIKLNATTGATAVPTSSHGLIRYINDGGGSTTSTLGFLIGQTHATPSQNNVSSNFWSMMTETDGGTGNRIVFEPIVGWGSSDTTINRSFIGWHNQVFASYIYYNNAGYGTNSFPSFTFNGDNNTGMYRSAADIIGFSAGGAAIAGIYHNGFYPLADDSYDIGTGSYRWDDIFATSGTVNTSDSRLKENIQPAKLGLDFINDLNPITYKWKKKKEKKVDATHHGIIAQEVVETLKDHGIGSLEDFGGIYHDGEDETYYGARYTEFIPILMKAIQELSTEVKELKEKL